MPLNWKMSINCQNRRLYSLISRPQQLKFAPRAQTMSTTHAQIQARTPSTSLLERRYRLILSHSPSQLIDNSKQSTAKLYKIAEVLTSLLNRHRSSLSSKIQHRLRSLKHPTKWSTCRHSASNDLKYSPLTLNSQALAQPTFKRCLTWLKTQLLTYSRTYLPLSKTLKHSINNYNSQKNYIKTLQHNSLFSSKVFFRINSSSRSNSWTICSKNITCWRTKCKRSCSSSIHQLRIKPFQATAQSNR